MLRVLLFGSLLAFGAALAAQTPAASGPLAPLADWAGGQWVAAIALPDGSKLRLIRSYEWSFGGRLLVGRSFGERDGKRTQTRETHYFWNADAGRIEFTDHIDQGGFGAGSLEPRDGRLFMEAKVVGNPQHPSWRAWMDVDAQSQKIRVEALRDGKWVEYGSFDYRRER